MINVELSNGRKYEFSYVVFDYNGVLAENGRMSDSVRLLLNQLTKQINVVVITADTFKTAQKELESVPEVQLIILSEDKDGTEKARYVADLGQEKSVVVGNGVNDQPMFFVAGLKICVIGSEGVSSGIMAAADVIVRSPEDAIGLFLHPERLAATLRP